MEENEVGWTYLQSNGFTQSVVILLGDSIDILTRKHTLELWYICEHAQFKVYISEFAQVKVIYPVFTKEL